jgi:hypothetical protein
MLHLHIVIFCVTTLGEEMNNSSEEQTASTFQVPVIPKINHEDGSSMFLRRLVPTNQTISQ